MQHSKETFCQRSRHLLELQDRSIADALRSDGIFPRCDDSLINLICPFLVKMCFGIKSITLVRFKSRSPHSLEFAQPKVEIKFIGLQLGPRTEHDVH